MALASKAPCASPASGDAMMFVTRSASAFGGTMPIASSRRRASAIVASLIPRSCNCARCERSINPLPQSTAIFAISRAWAALMREPTDFARISKPSPLGIGAKAPGHQPLISGLGCKAPSLLAFDIA